MVCGLTMKRWKTRKPKIMTLLYIGEQSFESFGEGVGVVGVAGVNGRVVGVCAEGLGGGQHRGGMVDHLVCRLLQWLL